VLFVGNPMYDEVNGNRSEGRIEILKHLKSLNKIDGEIVKTSEREKAHGIQDSE